MNDGQSQMLAKEEATAGEDALGVGDRTMISSHRRRGFADGKQRVTHRPISTEPKSTARCVPHTPQRAVSAIHEAHSANCLLGPLEPFKRDTAYLAIGN